MSNTILKIIPESPAYHLLDDKKAKLDTYLKNRMGNAEFVIYNHASPVFVDCGGNLEFVICPCCNAEISFDWWGAAMKRAHEDCFNDLMAILPCCGMEMSLNDLKYQMPCGFACVIIELHNMFGKLDPMDIMEVEKILGTPVRLITARY